MTEQVYQRILTCHKSENSCIACKPNGCLTPSEYNNDCMHAANEP